MSLGFVKDVRVSDSTVGFTIELTTPACPVRERMRQQAREAVAALPGVGGVDVTMTARVRGSVKNVIPVASGKGGVGKSTVSANLALALASTGASVGIMDADVYGPTIPTLMNAHTLPKPRVEGTVPAEQYGVKIISMGFFLREDDAIIWRGPMLHKTIQHFLGNVLWGDLDYLIVDLPPGTGDVQLTLCQAIPLTGAAVVSTPQDVALKVAQKAIAMFNQLNTPVLGIIENMASQAAHAAPPSAWACRSWARSRSPPRFEPAPTPGGRSYSTGRPPSPRHTSVWRRSSPRRSASGTCSAS